VIGNRPSLVSESLWQIPHACTRTRTSLAFGSGTSRVTSSIGPPFLATCAYRPVNFAIATSPSNDGRTSPGGRPRLGLTGIALVGPADRAASMRARVEHRLDRSVLLPDHEDVVAAHDRLDEVTPLGDLGFVAQEQPRAPGDQLHLPLEDRGVHVDAAIDLAPLRVDPSGRRLGADRAHADAPSGTNGVMILGSSGPEAGGWWPERSRASYVAVCQPSSSIRTPPVPYSSSNPDGVRT